MSGCRPRRPQAFHRQGQDRGAVRADPRLAGQPVRRGSRAPVGLQCSQGNDANAHRLGRTISAPPAGTARRPWSPSAASARESASAAASYRAGGESAEPGRYRVTEASVRLRRPRLLGVLAGNALVAEAHFGEFAAGARRGRPALQQRRRRNHRPCHHATAGRVTRRRAASTSSAAGWVRGWPTWPRSGSGCFVSAAGDLLLRPARAAFQASLTGRTYRPFAEIRLAELGPDAGLVGAADLARRG